MFDCKKVVSIFVIAAIPLLATAQDQNSQLEAEVRRAEAQAAAEMREVQEERRETQRQMEEAARQHEQAMRGLRHADKSVDVEVRMREAERSLAIAAQRMADLSMRQLPRVRTVERIVRSNKGPVLGVTIGGEDSSDPVEGVQITAVSPGGAAADVGLRSGDIMTAINGESLTADNSAEAADKLLDFMAGVELGDELTIEYLRDGKATTIDLQPRPMSFDTFTFSFDGDGIGAPDVHVIPPVADVNRFVWVTSSGGFGDMELVKLTADLGRYFGTDEGLLVVRAPGNEELKLKDGDVIRNIDGRVPSSASHAMRILGSYETGETLNIEIMRDKRKSTVAIEVPEVSSTFASPAPAVQVLPPGAVHVPRNDEN